MGAAIQITQENWAAGYVIPGFRQPPIQAFLGSQLVSHDLDAGILTLRFPTLPAYANPAGMVMGGIVSAMLDGTMGPLAAAMTGGTRIAISTDLHTQFFKGVPIGPPCTVVGRIDRMGRTVAYTSAEVLDETGAVCARAMHTAVLMDAPK